MQQKNGKSTDMSGAVASYLPCTRKQKKQLLICARNEAEAYCSRNL